MLRHYVFWWKFGSWKGDWWNADSWNFDWWKPHFSATFVEKIYSWKNWLVESTNFQELDQYFLGTEIFNIIRVYCREHSSGYSFIG